MIYVFSGKEKQEYLSAQQWDRVDDYLREAEYVAREEGISLSCTWKTMNDGHVLIACCDDITHDWVKCALANLVDEQSNYRGWSRREALTI